MHGNEIFLLNKYVNWAKSFWHAYIANRRVCSRVHFEHIYPYWVPPESIMCLNSPEPVGQLVSQHELTLNTAKTAAWRGHRMQIHFTCCLNINVCWKCVHIHPIMIKIHPVVFKIPFLKSGCSEIPVRMTWFCAGCSYDSWLTTSSYLRPALSELRAVRHCVNPWCVFSDIWAAEDAED